MHLVININNYYLQTYIGFPNTDTVRHKRSVSVGWGRGGTGASQQGIRMGSKQIQIVFAFGFYDTCPCATAKTKARARAKAKSKLNQVEPGPL